jgi:nucleotide-binding universal stress UspA family protein
MAEKGAGMKFVVGYNGSDAAKRALDLACQQAKAWDALVYVITSMKSDSADIEADIEDIEAMLQWAKDLLLKARIQCETIRLCRGLSPGEDLVQFARDNGAEKIFLGIEKRSAARKILLGSTAQYVILKGPCPVVTTK